MLYNTQIRPESEIYKYWTQQEDEELTKLVGQSLPFKKIGEIMKRSASSCQCRSTRILKLKNNYIRKTLSHNENFFSIPNEINSYWAGFTAADGCILIKGEDTNTSTVYVLTLSAKDVDTLNVFKNQCNYSGEIRLNDKVKPKSNKVGDDGISHMATFKIHSAYQWAKDLENNFNVIPKKTYRLGPPKNLTLRLLICYLIGYIDGDGTIFYDFKPNYKYFREHISISVVSSSEELIKWMKYIIEIIAPLNFSRSNKSQIKNEIRRLKHANAYGITFSGIRALLLCDYLRQFPVPRMSRKWDQPEVLKLIEENRAKYPEIFSEFKKHTDNLTLDKPVETSIIPT